MIIFVYSPVPYPILFNSGVVGTENGVQAICFGVETALFIISINEDSLLHELCSNKTHTKSRDKLVSSENNNEHVMSSTVHRFKFKFSKPTWYILLAALVPMMKCSVVVLE